jgi:hypothetical protein
MSTRAPHTVIAVAFAAVCGSAGLYAEQDAAAPDANKILKELQTLSATVETQTKSAKMNAAAQISSAASGADGGVSLWKSAVRATQMEGASSESNVFRVWSEGDGAVFKEKEVQNAVRLHLEWLALTLQRSAGVPVKELLPAVSAYARDLWADIAYMSMLEESIKKDKEAPAMRGRNVNKNLRDDNAVKRTHDQILHHALEGSIVVQWMRLGEFVNVEEWEKNPGSIDGIYKNIIQPELRAEKDQRVFEYWDTKMKVEADAASRTRLNFQVEKYNNETGPSLAWGRAEEYIYLGQKNRAATEMYNVIQKYPHHPEIAKWIEALQGLLAPPPTSGATATQAPAPAALAQPAPAPIAPAPLPAPAPAPAPTATAGPGVSPATLALPGAAPTSSLPGAVPGQ